MIMDIIAVDTPEKNILLCDEVSLTVRYYGCPVEQAMKRYICKDRRVLTHYRGIDHLSILNAELYATVSDS